MANGATLCYQPIAMQMLSKAGFSSFEIKQLAHDFQDYYYIIKKS